METINSGDTAWIIVATALVLMMTPALAFFYGGMVRKKNILSTLNLSFITIGLISIQWILIGYTLAFAPTMGGWLGNLKYIGLSGVGSLPNAAYAPTIPHLSFSSYQMMFAVITPALITGAFVERIRFKTFLVFTLLWATLVYDPVCHWVWAEGGILRKLGALDFAGGTVVHITAGFAALAFAVVIGARKGYGKVPMEPSRIPYTVLGAGLLWMGWFGFNGGSALGANGVAVNAIVATNTAAAAACLVWMFLSWWLDEKPSVLGIVTGAVVGLVAITPASGFVKPTAAIAIGGIAAAISYFCIRLRQRWNLDESLDVWACHGMGGTTGALLTGLFATTAVNEAGADGLFYGNAALLGKQAAAAGIVIVFSFAVTFAIAKVLNWTMGLRVRPEEEEVGLDISSHGERSFA
jgi:ammonium transporter, Amt family